MLVRVGLILLFLACKVPSVQGQYLVEKDTLLMGSSFSFTAVASTEKDCWQAINAGITEVVRIEHIISSWNESSETAAINKNAGVQPVKVSQELFDLIARCKRVSELSNGYFDISYASLDKVWNFKDTIAEVPEAAVIEASVSKINYFRVILDKRDTTVFLKDKGMKIGFGAIGKGYAANKAKEVMLENGATSGVVNAGGDLISWGYNVDGKPWSIGIADPEDEQKVISWLNISDMAVVTSGNYERYVMINGKRYGHIIDPKTGWPVTGLKSVTIICTDAELADALATTVFVLGEEEGMSLVNQLEGVEGIIVNDGDEVIFSKHIEARFIEGN